MGVSAAKFESAGQISEHYIPGAYSRRSTVGAGNGVSAGNLAILGVSTGGKPLTLHCVTDKAEAKDLLVEGDLLEAVSHAFTGSNEFVPSKVYCMRVNNGTQATRTLYKENASTGSTAGSTESDSDTGEASESESTGENESTNESTNKSEILKVLSKDYGSHTNQVKMWFKEDGSNTYKVTVSYKGSEESVSGIQRKSFSIIYTGSGNYAWCDVNKSVSGVYLHAYDEDNNNTDEVTITSEECPTIEELVAKINDTGLYSATVLDNRGSEALVSELDSQSFEIASEAKTYYSNLQALIEALESIQYIGSVEVLAESNNRVIPDSDTGYVYFEGAEAGSNTIDDWNNALELLEKEDIQIIATPSTDPDIHSLISDHCTSMSTVSKKKERTFWVGMKGTTTIEEGIEEAKSLNSELGSLVITGANANDPLTGSAVDISPALLACKCAGIEAALAVSNPLTNKTIKVNSFSEKYKESELETMIQNGIVPFAENEDGNLVCIRCLTTYQTNSLIQNERSMTRSVLYMDRDLRQAYSRRIGTVSEPSESDILNVLENKAKEWYINDLITRSDDGDLVFNEKVTFSGDKTYVTFERYIRAPNNFIFITGTNQVYSSTVEV